MTREAALVIDTSDTDRVTVRLIRDGKAYEQSADRQVLRSQAVLPLLERLLLESGSAMTDIRSVRVNPGPGSYTGLRVGFAVANTLALMLGIPVNGIDPPAFPTY